MNNGTDHCNKREKQKVNSIKFCFVKKYISKRCRSMVKIH